MQSEWLFSHLSVPSEINLLSEASLLPEDRHRASDLHMADQIAVANNHDLFSLTEVGHIALVIDASCIVPSASSMPHPS